MEYKSFYKTVGGNEGTFAAAREWGNPMNEDHISRLIDANALVPDYLVTTPANNTPCKEYVSMEQIHNAPTIEPGRKVGRWIDHSDDGYVECPFCRSATNCDNNINELHYCFSCGAKMEVEDDGKQ